MQTLAPTLESPTTTPEVRCSKCGLAHPAGTNRCSSCQTWLPKNGAAVTHGLSGAQREGRQAMSEEAGKQFQQFVDRAIADLGGMDAISQFEIALIEAAGMQYAFIGALSNYLMDVSPLTARGRVRTALRAYHDAVDRLDRLSQRLGLQRRPGWEKAHHELDVAEDERDDQ